MKTMNFLLALIVCIACVSCLNEEENFVASSLRISCMTLQEKSLPHMKTLKSIVNTCKRMALLLLMKQNRVLWNVTSS